MTDGTMVAAVEMACEGLSDMELAVLNNVAQVDWNPKGYPWYEKVRYLFTDLDGTRMHQATKDALASVVLERLSSRVGQ